MGVHECVCMYRRRSNKRIPFRGCDPLQSLLSTPKNKQTNSWVFLQICEWLWIWGTTYSRLHCWRKRNKQVQPEYQKWLPGNSAVCFKVPQVPVSLEENKWNYPFTWFSGANPKRLHPALVPQAKTGNVRTEEDVLRLMTRGFSSRKAEKDPFMVEEAE